MNQQNTRLGVFGNALSVCELSPDAFLLEEDIGECSYDKSMIVRNSLVPQLPARLVEIAQEHVDGFLLYGNDAIYPALYELLSRHLITHPDLQSNEQALQTVLEAGRELAPQYFSEQSAVPETESCRWLDYDGAKVKLIEQPAPVMIVPTVVANRNISRPALRYAEQQTDGYHFTGAACAIAAFEMDRLIDECEWNAVKILDTIRTQFPLYELALGTDVYQEFYGVRFNGITEDIHSSDLIL